MMRERKALLCVLLTLLLAGALAGCKKKTPATTPEVPATPAGDRQPPPPPRAEPQEPFPTEPFKEPESMGGDIDEWNRSGVLKTVYFSYDSSDLGESAKQTLQRNAEWLKAHPDTKVVVEGHCDERGTIEYNVALGERRAGSVRDYLSTLGVARPRIRIKTFGEERPVDPGHGEGAWTKNRRGEFVLER